MNLIIFCGASGSGKSTLSKKLAKESNLARFSMDELKFFLHSDLLPLVSKSLENGESILVDALYTKLKWRKAILEATEKFQCKRTLVYVDTPLNECVRRNRGRENILPDFVIEDIYNSIEPPTLDEGWDEIIVINNDKDIENLENEIKNLNLLGGDSRNA